MGVFFYIHLMLKMLVCNTIMSNYISLNSIAKEKGNLLLYLLTGVAVKQLLNLPHNKDSFSLTC